MFDIGFSELLVIAVVALIVIGPERLPKVARTLGHLFGRMQRYVNDVKADITREMELEELRKLQSTVEEAARAIQGSVDKEVSDARTELDKVAAAAAPDHTELAPPPAAAQSETALPAAAQSETALPPAAAQPDAPAPQQQLDLALDSNTRPPAPKQPA